MMKNILLDCPLCEHVRKKYSKLLDTYIFTCLLNPHSHLQNKPVNTSETVLMSEVSLIFLIFLNNLMYMFMYLLYGYHHIPT